MLELAGTTTESEGRYEIILPSVICILSENYFVNLNSRVFLNFKLQALLLRNRFLNNPNELFEDSDEESLPSYSFPLIQRFWFPS